MNSQNFLTASILRSSLTKFLDYYTLRGVNPGCHPTNANTNTETMKTIITALLIAALAPALLAEERKWTNSGGKSLTAELTGIEDGKAVLQLKDKQYMVPIASLSEADRAFIAEWQKAQETAVPDSSDSSGKPGAAASKNSKLLEAMEGSLVKLDGRDIKPYEIENPENIKVLAFYSSASWCGPCQAFSPTLGKEYKSLKRKYPNFELVLLTSDRNREDWEEYIKDHKMPFPSIDFDKSDIKGTLASGKNFNFIPSLLIKTVDGEVLDDASKGASESLEHLEDILKEYAAKSDS